MSTVEARDAILSAAESLFTRYGFKKTSIDEIARQARVGKGTVYLHFASKEELFVAVARRVYEQMLYTLQVAMRRVPTPEAKLRAFVQARVTEIVRIAREHGVTEDRALEYLPMAEAMHKEYQGRELDLLEEVLLEGKKAGVFEVEQPHLIALVLVACLQGIDLVIARLAHPPELRAALDQATEIMLRGLSPGRQVAPALAP